MLFVGRGLVREIDRGSGLDKVVREIKTADYGIKSPQKAVTNQREQPHVGR